MKNQQEAEKEEHQRIKNLVLNYDLRESEDHDGKTLLATLMPNSNIDICSLTGHEKPNSHHHNRLDNRSGKERAGQRVRKLQLSDVDWYGTPPKNQFPDWLVSVKARHPQVRSGLQARSHRVNYQGPHKISPAGRGTMYGKHHMCPSPGAPRPARLLETAFT